MSDDRDETGGRFRPPTPAEIEAAARLRAALEEGDPARESDVAALLVALGTDRAGDEVAARRLRRTLVEERRGASRRRIPILAAAAAIAAALVFAVVLPSTVKPRNPAAAPTADLLDRREAAARAALAGLRAVDAAGAIGSSLLDSRLEALRSSRIDSLLGTTSAAETSRTPLPEATPRRTS